MDNEEKINVESIAHFSWAYGKDFLLKVNNRYFIWSSPKYGGDNTIKPYFGNLLKWCKDNQVKLVKDIGIHRIFDFCGNNVTFVR